MPTVDYPYIRAWGRLMGSFAYYVCGVVDQAREDNAPQDVIYHRTEAQHAARSERTSDDHVYRANGRVWYRFGCVTNESTRPLIERFVNELD